MGLETRTTGNTTYLQLDYGKKTMYIYSKEEKEGYEKHVTSTGTVSYRKYVNAVSGKITGAYFRDSKFGGKEFVLIFTDNDGKYSFSIGTEDSVFQNIARSIDNLDINNVVRLSIYESKSKTSDKTYFGTSLSYPDLLDDEGKATLVAWGEALPEGKKLRSGKWDFTATNDEAYARVEDFINRNSSVFNNYSNQNTNSDSTSEVVNEKEADDDDDDMPF